MPWAEDEWTPLLGLALGGPVELHARLEQGLPYEALERLRAVLDVPVARVAELVRIPLRTLARRKDAGRLQPEESDRLLRLARVVALALGLFEGDVDPARAWLDQPQMALGQQAPLDLATTDVGSREVERLIGRLEHGIPL
ncbi:MAG TPA: antitoxin Xre/MbcA/ParS toxin-binding domain-containing protein [Longimicrobiales bacterium]|nr:antitoxin Xre/MbcA/ParS toxin-binding domain-containing protein [Longimicrobiales bacterium]